MPNAASDARILVHMGHSKTGSTSIQKTLEAARPWLIGQGILYPETSVISHNHRVLMPAIYKEGDGTSLDLRLGAGREEVIAASEGQWKSVQAQVAASQPQTVILSAEGWLKELNPRSSETMTRKLAAISSAAPRMLLYMRSPASFYMSFLQQRLKGGHGLPLPYAIGRLAAIESFAPVFGRAPELRAFDRKRLKDGDVVSDFSEWIGLPDLVRLHGQPEANMSVSSEAMSVLQRLGADQPPRDMAALKRQRLLARTVRKLDATLSGPTRPRLIEAVAAHVNFLNADFVQLADDYGLRFDDFDYETVRRGHAPPEPRIRSVEDLCRIDRDRRDALERAARRDTAKAAPRRWFLPRALQR